MEKHRPHEFDEAAHRDIIDYYDQTRFDYRVAWLNDDNLAVHFGFYDRHATRHAQALNNTNRILAELAGIQRGEKVLDAGCGQGGSCFWLAREIGATAVGITPVKSQIDICHRKAVELGVDKATDFLQADYCHTPFEPGGFDVIWACESVCHATDKRAFYEEAYRLLRPGGRLIMAEYIRTARPLSRDSERLLAGWLHRWAIPDIDTREEHLRHAHQAGFENISLRDYTRYTWISLKNLHKISRRWIWIGHFLRWLGIRSKVQHGNHIGSIRQFQALQKGLWFYGVLLAEK